VRLEDIENLLKSIKPRVALKDKEIFNPKSNYIELSLGIYPYKGKDTMPYFAIDCVHYMDYDPHQKKSLGINESLLPSIKNFFRLTNNMHLINLVEGNLK